MALTLMHEIHHFPPVSQPITSQDSCDSTTSSPEHNINLLEEAAFYGRFSGEMQRDSSIDDQLRGCRTAAARNSAAIPDSLIFRDDAISGQSMHNRPALQELLRLAKLKPPPFRQVFIDDTSRLGRNLEEVLYIYKILKHHCVHICIASTNLDSRSPVFEMALTFAGMVDEQFVRGLRDKVRRGQAGAVLSGANPGGKCYGYRNVAVEDPTRKGLHGRNKVIRVDQEIDLEQSMIVLRIFEMYAAGMSYARIAKQLNKEGVTPPQPARKKLIPSWSHNGIRQMLFNERYTGTVIWGRTTIVKNPETGKEDVRPVPEREWVSNHREHQRIISAELWAAVRTRNAQWNTAHRSQQLGGMNRTEASRAYLFSGLLQCGLCEASITIGSGKGLNARYGCPYHRFRGVCANKTTILRLKLEAQLLGMIVEAIQAPGYTDLLVTEFKRQLAVELESRKTAEQQALSRSGDLNQERSSLSRAIANLTDAIATHGISPALSGRLARAERRLLVIDALLEPKPRSTTPEISSAEIATFLDQAIPRLAEVLLGDPVRAKQELLKRIDKLILTPKIHEGEEIFLVTGDMRLFPKEVDDVMPTNSLQEIGQHYTCKISFDGFMLNPKQKAA